MYYYAILFMYYEGSGMSVIYAVISDEIASSLLQFM